MVKAKVSVVIPVYKIGKQALERCVESLINQTLKPIEIILVDDGSPDDCGKICDLFESKYSNVSVIHQDNSGVSTARNNGMKQATGEYISFVDADDYCATTMLEELYSIATSNPETEIIACSYNLDDKGNILPCKFLNTEKIITFSNSEEKIRLYSQLNCPFYLGESVEYTAIGVPWAKLYRLDFLRKHDLYFDSELRRMQDNVFNMFAFEKATSILYTPKNLYYYNYEHIKNFKLMNDVDSLYMRINNIRRTFYNEKGYTENKVIQSSLFMSEIRMFTSCLLRKYLKKKGSLNTQIECFESLFSEVNFDIIDLSNLKAKQRFINIIAYRCICFYIMLLRLLNFFNKKGKKS